MEQKSIVPPSLRIVAALLLNSLIVAMILPNTGCILEGPPMYPKFYTGMWHFGELWFYPGALLFPIGYAVISVGCIIYGSLRRSKFETAGWIMLGLVVIAMLFGK